MIIDDMAENLQMQKSFIDYHLLIINICMNSSILP